MKKVITNILRATQYLTVSTVDKHGNPWGAPLRFVADEDMNLYWWTTIATQHTQNLQHNPTAFITIFDSNAPEGKSVGLYIEACVAEVTDDRLDDIITRYNATTKLYKVSRENCTGDAPMRLYQATPVKIWVNTGAGRQEYAIEQ